MGVKVKGIELRIKAEAKTRVKVEASVELRIKAETKARVKVKA